MWRPQGRQMKPRGQPGHVDMSRPTQARSGSAATWRAHSGSWVQAPTRSLLIVMHLPVGTRGPSGGERCVPLRSVARSLCLGRPQRWLRSMTGPGSAKEKH